jgi:hypothetical protein
MLGAHLSDDSWPLNLNVLNSRGIFTILEKLTIIPNVVITYNCALIEIYKSPINGAPIRCKILCHIDYIERQEC